MTGFFPTLRLVSTEVWTTYSLACEPLTFASAAGDAFLESRKATAVAGRQRGHRRQRRRACTSRRRVGIR